MCIKSVKPHDLAVRSGPLNGTRGGGDMKKRQLQIARGPVRKTVTSYQNGRLQKVLLPLLAAGSSLVIPKMIKEEPQDQDEQVPEMQTFKYEEKNQQRAFGAVAGESGRASPSPKKRVLLLGSVS